MTLTYIDVIALLEGHSSNMKTKWLRRYLKHHFSAANAAMNATGSFHQIWAKIKDVWNHHLDNELKPWHVDRRRSKATWKPNQCAGDNTCYGQIRDIHLSSESTKIMQRHDSDTPWWQNPTNYSTICHVLFSEFLTLQKFNGSQAPCCRSLQGLCSRPWSDLWMQIPICPTDISEASVSSAWSQTGGRRHQHEGYRLEQQNLEPQTTSGGQRSRYTHIITVCHDNVFEWNRWIQQYRKHMKTCYTWKKLEIRKKWMCTCGNTNICRQHSRF